MVKILTSGGATAAWYEYDAWGNVVSVGGNADIANLNPIRYRGYYYDTETGFYYLNSRYYDPEICRFINADGYTSTGQGLLGNNMFAYCLNNPLLCIDPTGTEAVVGGISIGLLIVGALTDIGVSVSVSLLLGTAISELAHIQSKDWIKEKTEEKDIAIPRIPDIPIRFPSKRFDTFMEIWYKKWMFYSLEKSKR